MAVGLTMTAVAAACFFPTTDALAAITKQPQDVTMEEGASDSFTVETDEANATYQWQVDRGDGNGFVDVSWSTSATHTTMDMSKSCDGYRYRCVVTANGTQEISDVATLHVLTKDEMAAQEAADTKETKTEDTTSSEVETETEPATETEIATETEQETVTETVTEIASETPTEQETETSVSTEDERWHPDEEQTDSSGKASTLEIIGYIWLTCLCVLLVLVVIWIILCKTSKHRRR